MSTSKVVVKGGPLQYDEISIDGQDITNKVRGMSLSLDARELPVFTFKLIPEADLEIDGVVQFEGSVSEKDVLYNMKNWLSSLSGSELESQALALMSFGDDGNFGDKILQILLEMVEAALNESTG